MEMCLDFLSAVLDEVALEGLDGITLPTLWVRLENRPNFPLAIDEDSKSYLWKCFAVRHELEMFELLEPRPTFVPFNRYKFIDEELGIVVEPDEVPLDLYPVQEVEDGDIRGSCATYYTRKCITSEVRQDGVLLMSLCEAMEKWSQKLVLVASQTMRCLSLFGSEVNPLLEMGLDVYCLLERIGRSRYYGEVTQGPSGLLSLREEYAKKMHYLRIKLTSRKLITKQLHYSRNKNGVTVKGSLFHLTRFYVLRKCKMENLVKCICSILEKKTDCRELSRTLRMESDVKEGTFKKLFHKPFQTWFKMSMIPYREMYPEATDKACITCHGQERMLKIVSLIRPYVEEEEEEERNECDDERESTVPQNCYFDPYKIIFNKSLVAQAYDIVHAAGPEGITAQEIREAMPLPKLQIRGLCKTLLKFKVVMTLMQDRGRQRVTRFISKKFEKESQAYTKIKEQQQKFLGLPVGSSVLSENTIFSDVSSASVQPSDVAAEGQTGSNSAKGKAHSNFQKIESEVIEVDKVQISKSEPKVLPCFGEALKSCEPGMVSKRSISLRLLERANKIVETMQSVKVVLVHELKNIIVEHEAKEGLVWKMDKKSNLRLLDRLVREGHLKYVKMILKLDNTVKELDFVCHPSVSANDPLMKAAIEQAKFKYFGVSKTSQVKTEKTVKGETTKEKETRASRKCNLLTDRNVKCSPMEYAPSVGRTIYGLQSKFVRSKYLHLFLFYLVRGYEGFREKHDEPFVHHNSNTWKRFIPPPPVYPSAGEGWCILSDIILCMPLSIFLKIVNIRYIIFGLEEYLDDPVKNNYLIKHLPQELRNALLCGGRYKWMIFEVMQRLCYMGLISFGQQLRKEKDQVFIYLHKNASIKDTTVSPPGYIFIDSSVEYEVNRYTFNVLEDVETYWYNLEHICLHTNLSRYSVAEGQNISTIDISHKDEMIKACKNVDFGDVVDDGHVPGDSLGAAGLDSALFAHLKRNWFFASSYNQMKKCDKQFEFQTEKSAVGKHLMKMLLQDDATTKTPHLQSKLHRQRLARNSFLSSVGQKKSSKRSLSEESKSETAKRRKTEGNLPATVRKHVKVRTIQKKAKTKRKPYYDEKDKAAMKKMSKQRVDWSPQEDSFLLLCKVASLFLNSKMRCLVVPFSVVRDLLHERFPDISANKSSRACQRRVRYMLLNPVTRVNVSVFLGEARQDDQLVQEYDVHKPPKTQEDEWRVMFSDVLKKLLTKFTSASASRCQRVDLPDTLAELRKRYTAKLTSAIFAKESYHRDPENVEEIYFGVVTSLALSSFSTIGDKLNWSYTIYKLFKQYPDKLLLTVVDTLRSQQLITKKRDYTKKMIPVGHMSSLSFRFSVTYENSLSTRYPTTVFEEAAEFFYKLGAGDSRLKVMFDGNVCGGYCGAVLSLITMGLLKFENIVHDQILFLDTCANENERLAFIKQLNLSEPLEEKVSSLVSHREKSDQNSLEEPSERPAKRVKLSEPEDQIPQANELLDGENMNEHSMEAEVSERINSEGKVSKGTSGVESTPTTKAASRLALYMLRQEYCLPPTEKAQHSQDYFVINSRPIYCTLRDENYDSRSLCCFPAITPKVIGGIDEQSRKQNFAVFPKYGLNLTNKIINNNVSSFVQYIPEDIFEDDTSSSEKLQRLYENQSVAVLADAQHIVDYIYQSAVLGVTGVELWNRFQQLADNFTLHAHLTILREEFLIFRVGVTCFRYVHVNYANPWIISSFIIPKELRSYATECMKAVREEHSSDDLRSNMKEQQNRDCDVADSIKLRKEKLVKKMDRCQKNLSPEIPRENFEKDGATSDNLVAHVESETNLETPSTSTELCTYSYKSEKVEHPKVDSWIYVKFISRVWRKPDGTLNRPVLVKYLTSLVGHLVSFPGSSESGICERFSYVLQPVQTLELLEFLEEIGCVCKYYVKKHAKTSLFSAAGDSFITVNPKPENIVHYQPAIDAVIKMGKIKEAILLKH